MRRRLRVRRGRSATAMVYTRWMRISSSVRQSLSFSRIHAASVRKAMIGAMCLAHIDCQVQQRYRYSGRRGRNRTIQVVIGKDKSGRTSDMIDEMPSLSKAWCAIVQSVQGDPSLRCLYLLVFGSTAVRADHTHSIVALQMLILIQ